MLCYSEYERAQQEVSGNRRRQLGKPSQFICHAASTHTQKQSSSPKNTRTEKMANLKLIRIREKKSYDFKEIIF